MNTKVLPVFVVSFLCLVHVSKCWTAIEIATIEDKELLAKGYSCKSSDEAVGLMKDGEEIFLKGCSTASCGQGMISYTGCGTVDAGPGCVITQDLSKNYPKCCQTVKCKQ